ncbi:DUF222 domain-containing protein [Arthrobacter sp. TMP15]|uniref:HNH endonuclease signature motif containing protein n=1 Tax=Arthrobacter sp. TMP15 TaxID=3140789 RepID=UPI0031BA316F
MGTTARTTIDSLSNSGLKQVGEHVHQLLALAGALVRATTNATTSEPESASTSDLSSPGSTEPTAGEPFGLELSQLTDKECVKWAQDLEKLLRFGQALVVQTTAELSQRVDAGRYATTGVRGAVDMLMQTLTISAFEARRRIRLAEVLLPVMDTVTAKIAPTEQPKLGEAFFRGDVSQEQALLISKYVEEASRLAENGRISQEKCDSVQEDLVQTAKNEGPDFLRQVGNHMMSLLDPDGQKPSHADLVAKQGIYFRKPRRGLIAIGGHLTIAQYEQIMVILDRFANPNKRSDINATVPVGPLNPVQLDPVQLNPGPLEQLRQSVPPSPSRSQTSHDAEPGSFESDTLGSDHVRGACHKPFIPESATPTSQEAANFTRLKLACQVGKNTGAPVGTDFDAHAGGDDAEAGGGDAEADRHETGCGDPPCQDAYSESPDASQWRMDADDSGRLGSAAENFVQNHTEDSVQNHWVVNGVRIPFPDSGEELEGGDPIDPESTDPAVKDDRTRAQKLPDGLLDCLKLAARTDKLPLNGGLKAQLIISTRQEDLDRHDGTGTAFTQYSGPVPLALFDQSLCDPEIIRLGRGEGQEVLNVGRNQRLFTAAQRKILFARDLGCCFPDCTIPAPWAEAHHIIPWHDGGETNIDNAALLCGYHHTLVHQSDWTMKLLNGIPLFTAPYLLDPMGTQRRNRYHHGIESR